MATACVLYRPLGETDGQRPRMPSELRRDSMQATVLASPQNTNLPAVFQDTTNISSDLPTEEALHSEIEELHAATLIIDQAFYDINEKLSDAANTQRRRVDLYDTCRTLKTQWEEHHQTYRMLLWRSRIFAGEAQGAVDDFRELVLPSLMAHDKSLSEKKQIIQRQLEVLQELSQPSQNLSQEFLDFSRTLETYITEFSRVIENLEIDAQPKKVDVLESNLRAAKAAMEAVSQETKELGWKCVAGIAIGGIACLLALLTPVDWVMAAGTVVSVVSGVAAVGFGIQYLDARKRRYLATMEYDAVKAEYELGKASFSQMRKLESALDDARPLVQEVTMKLGIFANVWAAIAADLGKLKSSLHYANDPTSPLFIDRVQRLERMYGHLSQALRLYQVRVCAPTPSDSMPL